MGKYPTTTSKNPKKESKIFSKAYDLGIESACEYIKDIC